MKDGREKPWHVYFNHPFSGKRVTIPFSDEKAAKAENSSIKHRLKYDRESFREDDGDQDAENGNGELTVDDVLLMYLRDVAARKKDMRFAKRNMENTLSHLVFVRPIIGRIPVSELTRAHMREVVAELRKDKTITQKYKKKTIDRKIRGNSQATVNRKISIIQSALNWAEDSEIIVENPIRRFKAPRGPNLKPGAPTPEEATRILAAASDHVRRVVVIGIGTGARVGPSELFRLRWCDVSLSRNSIRIWSADKNQGIGHRDLDIKPAVATALKIWKEMDLNAGLGENSHIIHWRGKPVSSIKTAFWRTLERAGIDRRIRPYDCRHAFATQALANGADIKAVATLMGHADPTMILRHYQEVVEEAKRAAVDSVPDLVLPDLSTGPQDLTKPPVSKTVQDHDELSPDRLLQ
jgi:integrase